MLGHDLVAACGDGCGEGFTRGLSDWDIDADLAETGVGDLPAGDGGCQYVEAGPGGQPDGLPGRWDSRVVLGAGCSGCWCGRTAVAGAEEQRGADVPVPCCEGQAEAGEHRKPCAMVDPDWAARGSAAGSPWLARWCLPQLAPCLAWFFAVPVSALESHFASVASPLGTTAVLLPPVRLGVSAETHFPISGRGT